MHIPGLSLRSNPGLKLANAFGVIRERLRRYPRTLSTLSLNAFGVIAERFRRYPRTLSALSLNGFGVIAERFRRFP